MSWIGRIVAVLVGGAGIAYASGYDRGIFRALMNFGAGIFMYLLANVVDLFCWFLDQLPALPYSPDFVIAVTNLITLLARANTFFPVVETAFMFSLAYRVGLSFPLVVAAIPNAHMIILYRH